MQTFDNDDPGYLAWLTANPHGLVINQLRSGTGQRVLHRANCYTINGTPTAGKSFTCGQYVKVCFTSSEHIAEAAARANKACGTCQRSATIKPAAPPTAIGGGKSASADLGKVAPAATISAQPWQRWCRGAIMQSLSGITPLLDSFEAKIHPAQIKLQAYLDELQGCVGEHLTGKSQLFLHLVVDVGAEKKLLHHHDVENYLKPITKRLGWDRFVLVSGEKQVGGGSCLTIGHAEALPSPSTPTDWHHLPCAPGANPTAPIWRDRLRKAQIEAGVAELPPGPVAVQIAWRLAPTRNWVNLWKLTGDTMGPVLGPTATREDDNPKRFTPHDDRIVSLQLHREIDEKIGKRVDVGLWWREAPPESSAAMSHKSPS